MIDNLPRHIAIIPDGNRRWANQHGVPKLHGHQAGAEAIHNVVDSLINYQIKYLTLWGFSTDNWKRSGEEIESIFHLLAAWIEKDTPWLNRHGVQLRHIGRFEQLPDFLQLAIDKAIGLTKNNSGMTLALAFNYSGRAKILDAVRRLVEDDIPSQNIDGKLFSHYLYTDGMPAVDLVIRTAGEFHLSNFLLWQAAYSEYYFPPVLWPDFNEKEIEKALQVYSERQRRFGGD